jgi:membrane-associated protease RseP (regulator of RpoE activity)
MDMRDFSKYRYQDLPESSETPTPGTDSRADAYTASVARVLRIEDVTWGDPQKNFVVRYRGRLYNEDTAAAYDQLAAALFPLEITPLFRLEDGRHVVILARGVVKPKPSDIRVNIILLLLTIFSTFLAGAYYVYDGPPPAYTGALLSDLWLEFKTMLINLPSGWPFAVSLLAILLAHEFGHYLVGRFHKTAVSLPYFLPLPLPGSFGTLGAFIQLKEFPKNRRVLLDIGIAGPLAGLVVALPLLIYGLTISEVEPVEQLKLVQPGAAIETITDEAIVGYQFEGNSLLYLSLKYAVKGQWLPTPASYGGLSPAIYWVRYFFTGQPYPLGGKDVMLHPVAWAGWVGLLVTALNLIPAGQLDGGHMIYILFGRRAAKIVPYILGVLILLGFVWAGWWLWAFLIFIFGRLYAEPLDLITPLDNRRKALAALALVIFVLIFMPVPLSQATGILIK